MAGDIYAPFSKEDSSNSLTGAGEHDTSCWRTALYGLRDEPGRRGLAARSNATRLLDELMRGLEVAPS